jgi:hypothetical protein
LTSTWTIINAELLAWAKAYPGPRFHNLIADPPYALEFLGLAWDRPQPAGDEPDDFPANLTRMRQYQQWVSEWAEALIANVLHPGAVCALFGGPRTYHRLAAGLEDAGFEIFDQMMWLYGQGMAKGQNLDKAMDGAAFKAWLAQIEHGLTPAEKRLVISAAVQGGVSYEERHGRTFNAARSLHTPVQVRNLGPGQMKQGADLLARLIEQHWAGPEGTLPPGVRVKVGGEDSDNPLPATIEARTWQGYNTGLKPAWEPVILCRAPRKGKSFVYLAQTYGSGALNIDAGRIAISMDDPGDGQWGSSNAACNSGFNGSIDSNGYRSRQHPGGRWPTNVGLVHAEHCEPVGQRQVKGITGSKNGSWRTGNHYSGHYAGAAEIELGQRLGYADEHGDETMEAWACACGCVDCGAQWAAENLTTCPECDSRRTEWLCPVKLLDEQAGQLKSGRNNVRHGDRDKGWSGFQETLPAGTQRVAYGDAGPASRFFYAAKVSPGEANAGCEDLY